MLPSYLFSSCDTGYRLLHGISLAMPVPASLPLLNDGPGLWFRALPFSLVRKLVHPVSPQQYLDISDEAANTALYAPSQVRPMTQSHSRLQVLLETNRSAVLADVSRQNHINVPGATLPDPNAPRHTTDKPLSETRAQNVRWFPPTC